MGEGGHGVNYSCSIPVLTLQVKKNSRTHPWCIRNIKQLTVF